jgi:hypothetical protein
MASGTTPTAGVDRSEVAAGEQVTISGANFPPDTNLDSTLFSDPVPLGSTRSDGAGRYSHTVTIPLGTPLGAHDIVVAGGGAQASVRITVVAAAPARTDTGLLARTGSQAGTLVSLAVLAVLGGLLFVMAAPTSSRPRGRPGRMP